MEYCVIVRETEVLGIAVDEKLYQHLHQLTAGEFRAGGDERRCDRRVPSGGLPRGHGVKVVLLQLHPVIGIKLHESYFMLASSSQQPHSLQRLFVNPTHVLVVIPPERTKWPETRRLDVIFWITG